MSEAVITTNNNFTWFLKHLLKGILSCETGVLATVCGTDEKKCLPSEGKPSRALQFRFANFPIESILAGHKHWKFLILKIPTFKDYRL